MADPTPPGLPKGVPLFFDTSQNRFVPLGIVEDDGASDVGLLLSQIKQPNSQGSVSQTIPSANSFQTAAFSQGTQRNGLMAISVPYTHDPIQGTVSLRRNTGGLAGAIGIDHVDVQAQDARAFLYAVDEGTTTQSIPVLATAGGSLKVDAAAVIPSTITTAADVVLAATVTTSIIAANTARSVAIVQNIGANPVRVGDGAIVAGRGIELAVGESVTLETTAEIFALSTIGSTVTLTEIEA